MVLSEQTETAKKTGGGGVIGAGGGEQGVGWQHEERDSS